MTQTLERTLGSEVKGGCKFGNCLWDLTPELAPHWVWLPSLTAQGLKFYQEDPRLG